MKDGWIAKQVKGRQKKQGDNGINKMKQVFMQIVGLERDDGIAEKEGMETERWRAVHRFMADCYGVSTG